MIDIRKIKEQPEEVIEKYRVKGFELKEEINNILKLDESRRNTISSLDNLRAEQNKVSKEIPALKKQGADTTAQMEQMKIIKEKIKQGEDESRALEDEYKQQMLALPNLPDDDLLPGGKENNKPIREHGSPRAFDFEPKNHVDICTDLGMIDYARGAKLSGSGFWIYRGMGSRLEWALLNYFVDTHIQDGYELVFVPHMLGYDCGLTAGQFPKFNDDVFWIKGEEGERERFMLPTSETALVSLHMDEIIDIEDLPRKYISYTPCFRKEAGSYRASERGMVRGHQFNKVEMVQYTLPEDSDAAFEELVGKAETLAKNLGFHFKTVKLAAGDCSAAMARTYDIEVHIPSMGYVEISSVSNSRDYQARRGNIRFKRDKSTKTEFVNTLNGSGLATSRVVPAIVEAYQNADGSVTVPECLRKYLGGVERINPPGISG